MCINFILFFFVLTSVVALIVEEATKKICFTTPFSKLRAKRMSCFLRPDTGPCRSDIVQWYFDVKQNMCFRFFWGGCQGNGNRFDTRRECNDYCKMTTNSSRTEHLPHYCRLAFDYGTCFGHYYRYYWDNFYKACKRRLYSGCGGNQNNFETIAECRANCLAPPNNTFSVYQAAQKTTCFPA